MFPNPKKLSKNHRAFAIVFLATGIFLLLSYYVIPNLFDSTYVAADLTSEKSFLKKEVKEIKPSVVHLETPEPLKAIYMSQCVVGTPNFRQSLVEQIERTELNALMIDVKDFTGYLSFKTDNPKLINSVSKKCGAADMKEFIKSLHEKGIYVIARVTVFQDPYMSALRPDLAVRKKSDGGVWKDHKGLSFIDVGAKEHWDYIIEIAKESHAIGFDEINFDYVRFPSDGNMQDTDFTHSRNISKPEALRQFFEYLHNALKDTGMKTSVDIFGMTTTNTDDLNIGQVLENTFPYFDYVAPMVYPSHYPPNFNGWKNPNEHIYDIVNFAMGSAVKRAVATSTKIKLYNSTPIASTTPQLYTKDVYDKLKLRTWIQDFDYGGNYGAKEVRAQIQATYAVGLTSWMIWAPSNRYTEEGLLPESGVVPANP